MKKLMSLIMCLVVFFTLSSPITVFAQSSSLQEMMKNDKSLERLVKDLEKKGVPEAYIESKLPYKRDMLEDMNKIDGRFIKHEQKTIPMEQNSPGTSSTSDITVSPNSVISPNDLILDVTYWSRYDSAHPTHADTYTFYTDYDWASGNPYWTLTDMIGIAWQGGFTIESNSLQCVNKYYDAYWNEYTSTTGLLKVDPNAGFAYEIDLVGSLNGVAAMKNLGWAKADVYHYPDVTGSANIVSTYYHKLVTPGLPGVSISGSGPSISLSSYLGIDSATDYIAIDY